MGVWTDGRATEIIIFDQDVHKYVRVTTIMISGQVYVTNHNFITTDRRVVGYWHSYHYGQDQSVYHTQSLCAYIYLVYHTHPTLTYVPMNFGQYPRDSDPRTYKLRKISTRLCSTYLLTSHITQTTLTYVPTNFGQYPNDFDPVNNLDLQTLTIWTFWTIWAY